MHNFDIYFTGHIIEGHDPQQVRAAVGQLFKIDGKALERLFSGHAVKVKQDVDVDTAARYRAAFRKAGALVDIRPHGNDAQPSAPPPSVTAPAPRAAPTAREADLMPARSGSLADCAPPPPHFDMPDLTGVVLEEPGVEIDRRPRPAPIQIATTHLSALPAHSGTLADCGSHPAAKPLPDISAIDLAPNDGTPLDDHPPAAPLQLDISHLNATPANTGSLEDCQPDPPPAALPKIDHLRLSDD